MDSTNLQLQADSTLKDTPTSQSPRPLFIYGTLCAKPLLAWAITGNSENIEQVSCLMKPARVFGYKRVAVHHYDYPAVIKDDESFVDGFILQPRTTSQRRKLDDFEGEAYRPVAVIAHLTRVVDDQQHKIIMNESDKLVNNDMEVSQDQELKVSGNITTNTAEDTVDADIYLWDAEMEKLTEEAWSLEEFIATRLETGLTYSTVWSWLAMTLYLEVFGSLALV